MPKLSTTMASETQRAANRQNAAKSTGPRSTGGKRRSAQNARRHGLTLPPEEANVLRWYRIIRNDPAARLDDQSDSEDGYAALTLAEAEAHLERTRDAERDHLEKLVDVAMKRGRRTFRELIDVPSENWLEDDDMLDLMIKNYSNPEHDMADRDFMVGALKIIRSSNPNRPAELNRRMRTLHGYRKRAEGRRNRAFAAWLRFSKS